MTSGRCSKSVGLHGLSCGIEAAGDAWYEAQPVHSHFQGGRASPDPNRSIILSQPAMTEQEGLTNQNHRIFNFHRKVGSLEDRLMASLQNTDAETTTDVS